jgi:hypothetical protein
MYKINEKDRQQPDYDEYMVKNFIKMASSNGESSEIPTEVSEGAVKYSNQLNKLKVALSRHCWNGCRRSIVYIYTCHLVATADKLKLEADSAMEERYLAVTAELEEISASDRILCRATMVSIPGLADSLSALYSADLHLLIAAAGHLNHRDTIRTKLPNLDNHHAEMKRDVEERAQSVNGRRQAMRNLLVGSVKVYEGSAKCITRKKDKKGKPAKIIHNYDTLCPLLSVPFSLSPSNCALPTVPFHYAPYLVFFYPAAKAEKASAKSYGSSVPVVMDLTQGEG